MAQDFNQVFRPHVWDDIIGQEDVKQIIQAAIKSGNFPKFSIFSGPSGVGKSCTAEVVAHELIKASGITQDVDRHVVKHNMAKMLGKKDIVAVLDDIFKFEGVFGITVYILEEVQVLKQNEEQAPFLEELTKIPDDVYIMMCTTHVHKLLPALRNRATHFQLTVPSAEECTQLISRVIEAAQLQPMSHNSMLTLAYLSENVPRNILKHMQLLMSNGRIDEEAMTRFFKVVSHQEYIGCLGALANPDLDIFGFVRYIESVKNRVSLAKLMQGLRSFALTALIEASTHATDPSLSRSDRTQMEKVMSLISLENFVQLVEAIGKTSGEAFSQDKDAEYRLIMLKLQMLKLTPKTLAQDNPALTASQRAQSVHKSVTITTRATDQEINSQMSDSDIESILGYTGDQL